MSDIEVPIEDTIEPEEVLENEDEELDIEAPEADTADQHVEVELDEEDY
ncbi:hypothetical protein [Actinopolymorpha alba]|nr:hypothetical protein [Actinopolymorpha alba]